MNSPSVRPKFFYGYSIVAAGFVIQMLTWGLFNSYGVFFNPLLDEFSWSRAVIAGAASLSQFLVGVGAVVMGRLTDRFGPRILMTFGGVTVGLGFILMNWTQSPWHLYLFQGIIVGIGISGTDVMLLSTTARWFVRRRGLMSGIVKVGTGVGTMVAPLVINWLVVSQGWRHAYLIVGIALLVVVVAMAQLLRRDPAKMNLLPDGDAVRNLADIDAAESGYTLKEAARTRQFWMLCLTAFIVFFCTYSVIVHYSPSVVALGRTEAVGAMMVSILGGASIGGRLLMGVTNDRFGSRRSAILILALFVAVFAWLQFARDIWSLGIFSVVYGFCHGGYYTLASPLVAEYFGMKSHGTILGITILCGGTGGSMGTLLIGTIVDATGNYKTAFLFLLGMVCVGLAAILLAGKPKLIREGLSS